jgi:hypothetical protein
MDDDAIAGVVLVGLRSNLHGDENAGAKTRAEAREAEEGATRVAQITVHVPLG